MFMLMIVFVTHYAWSFTCCKLFQIWFFVHLCCIWQDFNWVVRCTHLCDRRVIVCFYYCTTLCWRGMCHSPICWFIHLSVTSWCSIKIVKYVTQQSCIVAYSLWFLMSKIFMKFQWGHHRLGQWIHMGYKNCKLRQTAHRDSENCTR